MKTLLTLIAVALAAGTLWNQKPQPNPILQRHEQAIAEHRVTLSMTREEVTRSLGVPDAERTTGEGDAVWTWKSGRWVKFTGRALVDSGIEAPARTAMSKVEAQIEAATPQAPAQRPQPGYHYEWSPASGHYVPVRDGSSWRKSVGL